VTGARPANLESLAQRRAKSCHRGNKSNKHTYAPRDSLLQLLSEGKGPQLRVRTSKQTASSRESQTHKLHNLIDDVNGSTATPFAENSNHNGTTTHDVMPRKAVNLDVVHNGSGNENGHQR
jgi:hypothetical protein